MTNTETIKTALIKQIIDSGSTLPLSVLVGNIDLLINTAKAEQCIAISDNVIGSHITEPELKVEDLKAGEWYSHTMNRDWLFKFDKKYGHDFVDIYAYLAVCIDSESKYGTGLHCRVDSDAVFRHATREEIIKYFPHEFEIDSHGGNDIPQLTDPQL
jgi:hypothetical protein